MAEDLSKLEPTGNGGPSAPAAFDPYKGPPQSEEDYITLVSTWVKALGAKVTVEDLQGEPTPYRNALIKGAQVYLARYKGDFEFLLEVRQRLTRVKNGRRVLEYPSIGQAKGILNCLRSELYRQPGSYSGPPLPAGQPAPQAQAPQAPARLQVEDAGVYKLPDGTICKVQANREKTKTYAKRLVEIGGERATESGERIHAEYQYAPGLVDQVAREGVKLTLAEAKALSVRYAFCIRCGRSLKDAKSVEAGMGPVCITYFAGGA